MRWVSNVKIVRYSPIRLTTCALCRAFTLVRWLTRADRHANQMPQTSTFFIILIFFFYIILRFFFHFAYFLRLLLWCWHEPSHTLCTHTNASFIIHVRFVRTFTIQFLCVCWAAAVSHFSALHRHRLDSLPLATDRWRFFSISFAYLLNYFRPY